MATNSKKSVSDKIQAEQDKHDKHAEREESDFEEKSSNAVVKHAEAKVAVAKKSASSVKEAMKAIADGKKTSAEVSKLVAESMVKVAAIEVTEAKELAEINERKQKANEAYLKDKSVRNAKRLAAIAKEQKETVDAYAEEAGKLLDAIKSVQAEQKLSASKVGKSIADALMVDRVEQQREREKDFLESRKDTLREIGVKLKVASVTGDQELTALLTAQAKEAKKSNIAVFDELQKRLDKRIEESDTVTQQAFKDAEKAAKHRSFFGKRIDKFNDSAYEATLGKVNNLVKKVGSIGFEGHTISDHYAKNRAKKQLGIADVFARNHKWEEDSRKAREEEKEAKAEKEYEDSEENSEDPKKTVAPEKAAVDPFALMKEESREVKKPEGVTSEKTLASKPKLSVVPFALMKEESREVKKPEGVTSEKTLASKPKLSVVPKKELPVLKEPVVEKSVEDSGTQKVKRSDSLTLAPSMAVVNFSRQSANDSPRDGSDAEIKAMRDDENSKAETTELKGIGKSLADLAKNNKASGGGGGMGGLPGIIADAAMAIAGLVGGAKALLSKLLGGTTAKGTEKALEKGTEKELEKATEKTGEKELEKGTEKASDKAVEKASEKTLAKVGEKSFAKSLLKKIPGIGLGMAAYFASERIGEGDYVGAAGEVASGVASLVPVWGTAVSAGIDVGLAARDMTGGNKKDGSTVTATAKPVPSKGPTSSGKVTLPPTGAGGGRGNGQAQMAQQQREMVEGEDGKGTTSGPTSGELSGLVRTGNGVDLSGLTPQASSNLKSLATDYNAATGKKLTINSAFRSYDKQAQLYADYKSGKPGANPANPPGSSLHEVGMAIDIQPSQVDEMDRLGLVAKNGFERIAGPKERQHIQLAGAQAAVSSGTSKLVSGDTLGAGTSTSLGAGESFVDAPTSTATNSTQNDKISVSQASNDDNGGDTNSVTSVNGPSYNGAGGGRGGGGAGGGSGAISVTSIQTFMFNDPAFFATNVQAMA